MPADLWTRLDATFSQLVAAGPDAASRAVETMTTTDPELARHLKPIVQAYVTHATPTRDAARGKASTRRAAAGPGDRIGRYQILGRIGQGGMGTVYRAYDPEIGRIVAIKVLHTDDEGFLREVRAAGRLTHPNIVTIYDCAKYDDRCVIVMEHIDGRTLADIIRTRGIGDLTLAVRILVQLCEAVGYAHDRGIVHRDIKPANLILDRKHELKVLDFGLANMGEMRASEAGVIAGTFMYMSPEQMRGLAVDRRSDIFAIGAVAYELLASRHPFADAATTLPRLIHAVLDEAPPPLAKFCPTLPPVFNQIVETAMRKDPTARYVTLSQMAGDLRQLDRTPVPIAPAAQAPAPQATRASHALLSPMTWLALVVPVIAAVAVTAVMLRRPTLNGNPGPTRTNAGVVARDRPTVFALFANACRNGSAVGCLNVARALRDGRGVTRDVRQALPPFEQGCTLGSTAACVEAALLMRDVDGLKDAARAARLFDRACTAGNAAGCTALGLAYAQGSGVVKDETRAVTLFERACEGGDIYGCADAAASYAAGRGAARDDARANGLWQRACNGNIADACDRLAQRLARGQGAVKDPPLAAALARRAAQLRNEAAAKAASTQSGRGR